MAKKWNLQDIVPPDRGRRATSPARPAASAPAPRPHPARDMRPISTPPVYEQTTSFNAPPVHTHSQYDQTDVAIARLEVTDGRLSRLRRYIFLGVFVVVLGCIGFTATILLTGAEVTVTPKSQKTTVQAGYTAKLKPEVGELGYELLTLEESSEKQVAAKGQQDVSIKATGKIVISNEGSTPQRLIINTRFSSPSGLIYRISDSVDIPASKKDANGAVTPGTFTTTVLADGAGDSYNTTSGRLTVPGLKGSDQYDKVYAEPDKSGIVGGFEGKKFIIDETELATTQQQMQTELRDKLLSRIQTERPNGFILFKDAVTFTYDSLPSSGASDKAATLKERAMLHVPLFNEISFASFLAKATIPSYKGEPVRLKDPQTLMFKYADATTTLVDISTKDSLDFSLSGPADIIWKFDPEALKKDVASKPQSSLLTILQNYPSIDKAQAVIRPVWRSSFPANLDEIKITETIPSN